MVKEFIIIQCVYILVSVGAVAYFHTELINDGKRIKHGWWALGVGGLAVLFGIYCSLWYIPVLLAWRILLFSPVLNVLRGLPISYISTTTTSIIDKWEQKIFKTFRTRTIVYFILLIIFEAILLWQLKI